MFENPSVLLSSAHNKQDEPSTPIKQDTKKGKLRFLLVVL
jgi:hypothetical protein